MAPGRGERAGLAALLTAALCAVCGWGTACNCASQPSADPTGGAANGAPAQRDPRWAAPIQRPGLPNLHKLSDDLYRGAQPDDEGYPELKKMGIKTVLNLRSFHSGRSEAAEAGLDYETVPMSAWDPKDEDAVAFLRLVGDPAKTPIFVHCQHGADRTGLICAVYRVVIQGWNRDDALEEMAEGGFGFHGMWDGLPEYLRELDVENLKERAGLTEHEPEGTE